jgi:hypothetical protein
VRVSDRGHGRRDLDGGRQFRDVDRGRIIGQLRRDAEAAQNLHGIQPRFERSALLPENSPALSGHSERLGAFDCACNRERSGMNREPRQGLGNERMRETRCYPSGPEELHGDEYIVDRIQPLCGAMPHLQVSYIHRTGVKDSPREEVHLRVI